MSLRFDDAPKPMERKTVYVVCWSPAGGNMDPYYVEGIYTDLPEAERRKNSIAATRLSGQAAVHEWEAR